MTIKIAHLGPPGTYTEQAAIFYLNQLSLSTGVEAVLCPYLSIAQTLRAVDSNSVQLAVVPVENSIEGSVTMTLDTLWLLNNLQIQMGLVMPITHMLISCAASLKDLKIVYSHPQALSQCQGWLEQFLPTVQLIPSNSTTEALLQIEQNLTTAAISSQRAAQLYNLPILASGINDNPENATRFWVVSQTHKAFTQQTNLFLPENCRLGRGGEEESGRGGEEIASVILHREGTDFKKPSYSSLAFSLPANLPGALVKALQVFAHLSINLSRIESRPTKRSLGEYLFFIDAEADVSEPRMQSALAELSKCTELLKIFGSYNVLQIS